jgi:hypothetical protein
VFGSVSRGGLTFFRRVRRLLIFADICPPGLIAFYGGSGNLASNYADGPPGRR